MLKKQLKKYRRHQRIRAKIKGTAEVPRLYVFKSANHIYAQLINDEEGKTVISANDIKGILLKKENLSPNSTKKKPKKRNEGEKEKKEELKSRKVDIAYKVGKMIAQESLKKKIKKVVFDRGGYKYHGRVKALADGAREGGLKF